MRPSLPSSTSDSEAAAGTSRPWSRLPEAVLCTAMLAMLAGPITVQLARRVTSVPYILPEWGGLEGIAQRPARPDWSAAGWLSRGFQDAFDAWFSQSFPGREALVRANNQVDYSLFRKSYMNRENIIIAEDGQLYEKSYLEDFCNIRPPVPEHVLESRVSQMATLQTELRARGIPSVVVISPSKAALVPESIPHEFHAQQTGAARDYDRVIPLMEKHRVCFVDGSKLTAEARDSGTLVFPQGGIHWSMPAAFVTTAAMLDALRTQGPHTDLPRLELANVVPSPKPVDADGDLARLLNLFYPPLDYPTYHTAIARTPNAAERPADGRLIVVGCSFSQQMIRTLFGANPFEKVEYYFYYNKHVTFPGGTAMKPVNAATIDWDRDIFSAKAIVIEVNESLLNNPYYDTFTRDALQALHRAKQNYPPAGTSPLAARPTDAAASRN